ncbi:MAG: hypothetical protein WD845_09055 [Pirellulales bacterium]
MADDRLTQRDGRSAGHWLVRFELYTVLMPGETADAKILKWTISGAEPDYAALAQGGLITVFAAFDRAFGAVGERGWALYSAEHRRFEVISMEACLMRPATATSAIPAGATGTITVAGVTVAAENWSADTAIANGDKVGAFYDPPQQKWWVIKTGGESVDKIWHSESVDAIAPGATGTVKLSTGAEVEATNWSDDVTINAASEGTGEKITVYVDPFDGLYYAIKAAPGDVTEIYHITIPSPGVGPGAAINILLPNGDTESCTNWSDVDMDFGDKVTAYKDADDGEWYLIKSGEKSFDNTYAGTVITSPIAPGATGSVELDDLSVLTGVINWSNDVTLGTGDKVLVFQDRLTLDFYAIKSGDSDSPLVRFQLTEDRALFGDNITTAKIVEWDDGTSTWVLGSTEILVADMSPNRHWEGRIGHRGWAVRPPDHDDDDEEGIPIYEIVEMEHLAAFVRFSRSTPPILDLGPPIDWIGLAQPLHAFWGVDPLVGAETALEIRDFDRFVPCSESGDKVFCVLAPELTIVGPPDYMSVVGESTAGAVRFLTDDVLPESGYVTATQDLFWGTQLDRQDPDRNSGTVYALADGLFVHVISPAYGFGILDSTETDSDNFDGVTFNRYYHPVCIDQRSFLVTGFAAATFDDTDTAVNLNTPASLMFFPFSLPPTDDPLSVLNVFKLSADAGDECYAVWDDTRSAYILLQTIQQPSEDKTEIVSVYGADADGSTCLWPGKVMAVDGAPISACSTPFEVSDDCWLLVLNSDGGSWQSDKLTLKVGDHYIGRKVFSIGTEPSLPVYAIRHSPKPATVLYKGQLAGTLLHASATISVDNLESMSELPAPSGSVTANNSLKWAGTDGETCFVVENNSVSPPTYELMSVEWDELERVTDVEFDTPALTEHKRKYLGKDTAAATEDAILTAVVQSTVTNVTYDTGTHALVKTVADLTVLADGGDTPSNILAATATTWLSDLDFDSETGLDSTVKTGYILGEITATNVVDVASVQTASVVYDVDWSGTALTKQNATIKYLGAAPVIGSPTTVFSTMVTEAILQIEIVGTTIQADYVAMQVFVATAGTQNVEIHEGTECTPP